MTKPQEADESPSLDPAAIEALRIIIDALLEEARKRWKSEL